MTIENAAKALKEIAYVFMCSYQTAWEQHLHPAITEEFSFEEVMKEIKGE